MAHDRVGGSTQRPPVVNPPVGGAIRQPGEPALPPPEIDKTKARFVTGTRETEEAFPVAAGVRGSELNERQALAVKVWLRAAKLMFSDPSSGSSDPDSEVS
jgi:hypothetical protein